MLDAALYCQLLVDKNFVYFDNDDFSIMHIIINIFLCFQSHYRQIAKENLFAKMIFSSAI